VFDATTRQPALVLLDDGAASQAATLAAWARRLYPGDVTVAATIPAALAGADLQGGTVIRRER
jgi:hypothetical protein